MKMLLKFLFSICMLPFVFLGFVYTIIGVAFSAGCFHAESMFNWFETTPDTETAAEPDDTARPPNQ